MPVLDDGGRRDPVACGSLAIGQVLAILSDTPTRIAAVTGNSAPDQPRTHPAPGEWSANDVLAHLRSCADVWGACITTILAEDAPTIRAVNPTTWIKQTNCPDLAFGPSLRAFASQRADLLSALEPLAPEGWSRAATVTGAGRVLQRTMFSYARWSARHERPHVKRIERIVAAMDA